VTESIKAAYIEKIDQRGDFLVWIVNGSYIRGHIDEEFTNFGQHYRFTYIPLKEFWIDKEAQHDERQFSIDHLLIEHNLMSKGIPYDKALPQADNRERIERRRAGDVRKLTQSGKKLPDGHDVWTCPDFVDTLLRCRSLRRAFFVLSRRSVAQVRV
jgi:hypothetical protein